MLSISLRMVRLVFLASATLFLSACVQMPTEKLNVVDLRPQLSFQLANERLLAARVIVDGLDMGTVGEYLNGQAALRVVAGTHRVQVVLNGQVFLDEKLYLSDGVSRHLIVP